MNRKIKWIAILLAIVVFLALGSMLPAEPLTERSLVVGFGIDMDGEEGLRISAQILNPGGGKEQNGTETNLVSASGSTIAGAMSQISEKSSHTVALTHCNVVFIGRKVAETNNIYSVINYLVSNSYLSENAFLFLADGTAEDVLSSKTGFGDNASLYTQSVVGLYGEYSDIAEKTLQCFIVGYHSLGKSNWLPIVKKVTTPPKLSDESSSSDESQYLFDVNSVAIFYKNNYIGDYSSTGSRALNYIDAKIKKGAIDAIGDNGEKIVLYVTGNKVDKKFDWDTKTVSLKLELNCILKEIIDYGGEDKHIDRISLSDAERTVTEQKISAEIKDFYSSTQENNVDIYNFLEAFASRYGKKAMDLKIQDINIDVDVKLSVNS